jgi:PAS domain S-box-containing protein
MILGIKQLKKQISRLSEKLVDWLFGARAEADSRQRRRLRVLSAFLLLMTVFMLPGSIVMKSYSAVTSNIMLVTSGLLFCSYIISRTRFYTVAVILAIITPAITPTASLIFQPTGIDLAAGAMWVALPLLVAGLMLTLYKATLIVVSYIVFIIILAGTGSLDVETTAPLLAYLTIIAFFVISINNLKENDQREIENQLEERHQTEKALRESEEKFRNLFDHAKDAILLADLETQKIIDVNTAACNLIGLPKEKLIGKKQSDLNPPEMAEKYSRSFMEQLQKGFAAGGEIIVVKADGTRIPVDISASIIKLQGKTVILGIFHDISERARMTQALKESEENISKAFRAIPEAVSIATLKDGIFLEVNDSFLVLNGYSREEVIGHTAKDLNIWVNSIDRYRTKQLMEKQSHFVNEEFILRRKSGETHNVLLSADVINFNGKPCILTIGYDITERRRAEEALRDSEEKFHSIVEHGNDGIAFIQDGMVHYCNSMMLEIVGYTMEEVIGKPFLNYIAPEHKDMITGMYRKRLAGERVPDRYELNMLAKGGRKIYTEVSASLITIKQNKVDIAIVRDITQRKKAEAVLADEATRRRILIEQSSDGIVILDQDGKVYEANQRFADMLGYTMDEMKQLHVWDWEVDTAREFHLNNIRTLDDAGDHFETIHRRKDGTTYNVEISTNGAIFAGQKLIFGVCRDITARKQMEQQLRESEEKFSKVFHETPQLIAVSRSDTNIYIDVNDSFVKTTGYTREELIGHSVYEINMFVYPEEQQEIIQLAKKYGYIKNKECSFRMKYGEIRSWLCSTVTININNVPCAIASAIDVTDRKIATEELKRANIELQHSTAQLQATNKELESFSYSVSHDLRSPLRSIDGFSQALLEDYTAKLDEKGQDYLNRLRGASQKIGDLIDGLLKLSRLTRSEIHPEKVDLGMLAKEIVSRLQETDPKRHVKISIGNNLVANGDPQMVRVLLENLLGNAWKFTSKTRNAQIELGKGGNGENNTFFIKDNGAGFDMAFKDKLFAAFQRLHQTNEFPGTGIGLATVQRIINRHGGTIRAEGEVNKGATFYFSLS